MDIYQKNKRIIKTAIVLIILTSIICFLKIQTDDERYYMIYDFEDEKEEAYDPRGIFHTNEGELHDGEVISSSRDGCSGRWRGVLVISAVSAAGLAIWWMSCKRKERSA